MNNKQRESKEGDVSKNTNTGFLREFKKCVGHDYNKKLKARSLSTKKRVKHMQNSFYLKT